MGRKLLVREKAAAKRARLEAEINAATWDPHAEDDSAVLDRSVGAGTDVATVMRVFNVN